MTDLSQDRIDRVRRYWKAAAERDHRTIASLVAVDVVRSGPIRSPFDGVSGRDVYSEHIRKIQERLTIYRNAEHHILGTPDGRRVYLHCTEWDGMEGFEMEVPMVIIFDFNDTAEISKIDIYWKSTDDPALYKGFVEFLTNFRRQ